LPAPTSPTISLPPWSRAKPPSRLWIRRAATL